MTVASTVASIAEQDYQLFRDYIKNASGIVLGDNKKYLVTTRLEKLMARYGNQTVGGLIDQMKADDAFRRQIMDEMTTTERTWFRDNYPFDILKEKILPEIATVQPQEIRIWSAGCSTGQEPYSISIAVDEYLERRPDALPVDVIQIVATELSPKLLKIAENGIFEHIEPVKGLSADRKQRYFDEVDGGWEIVKAIRDRVLFRQYDLKENYTALGLFDIIYCRNVLIYFSSETRKDMLTRMARALKPGGYLVPGASETIVDYSQDFEPVRWRDGLVYRLRG